MNLCEMSNAGAKILENSKLKDSTQFLLSARLNSAVSVESKSPGEHDRHLPSRSEVPEEGTKTGFFYPFFWLVFFVSTAGCLCGVKVSGKNLSEQLPDWRRIRFWDLWYPCSSIKGKFVFHLLRISQTKCSHNWQFNDRRIVQDHIHNGWLFKVRPQVFDGASPVQHLRRLNLKQCGASPSVMGSSY